MRLNRVFFSEFDPTGVALFRIVFGLFILVMLLALFPNWEIYYGPGGVRPEPASANEWSLFTLTQSWVPIWIYWGVGVVAALMMIVGYKTRLAVFVLFILQTSMNHADPMVVNGEDLMVRLMLFYSIFAPLGHRLSLDARLHPDRYVAKPLIWPVRLMQLNIAGVYAFSLPIKLSSDVSWLNGEALYWVMMSSTWHRWPIQEFFYGDTLSQVMTFSAVLAEGLFPVLVWFRRTRLPMLGVMAAFHLGLGILLQHVTFFSFSMICSFPVFLPGQTVTAWLLHLKLIAARHFGKGVCMDREQVQTNRRCVHENSSISTLDRVQRISSADRGSLDRAESLAKRK